MLVALDALVAADMNVEVVAEVLHLYGGVSLLTDFYRVSLCEVHDFRDVAVSAGCRRKRATKSGQTRARKLKHFNIIKASTIWRHHGYLPSDL